jgi:hypothetical protein
MTFQGIVLCILSGFNVGTQTALNRFLEKTLGQEKNMSQQAYPF